METILVIEAITLFGIFNVGALLLLINEIKETIKKHKKEKAMKNFDPLEKF